MTEDSPGHEGRFLATVLGHGAARPDDAALTCGPVTIGWGRLREEVLAAAGAISKVCGPKVGNVALLGPPSVPMVIGYLGAIAAGGCAVPLPVSAHPSALARMVEDCEPALILVDEAHADMLDPALRARTVVLSGHGERLPESLLGGTRPLVEVPEADPASPFNIIYSSGTTGRPKGIVHSHAMRYRQASRALFGIDAASTMLLATPLYSNTTLMPMLAALFHGGRVVLMPKFDAEAYLELAERERATHTMLVPVQYRRILDCEGFARHDLSAFEVKQCTGAPLPAADKLALVQGWPGRFLEIYGLTEGGCTCILDVGTFPDKAHTVGRPAPGNDIRVVDEEGKSLPPGERGEIIGRSPTMMSGYHRNPEANAAFYWRDAEGRLFHRTGDIGMFDEDGFIVLLDRKKDVIISGGFNIHAVDLENALLEHPGVGEAAVIGVPSDRWGETPMALVVPRRDAAIDPAGLLAWANERLGRTQKLSALEFRDELPRSAVGKVLKQELRKPYWEE